LAIRSARATNRTTFIPAVMGFAVILLAIHGWPGSPPPATAEGRLEISSCQVITENAFLVADIIGNQDPCIQFGADNIKLELEGFTIDMRGHHTTSGPARAIHTNFKKNVRIQGPGSILTKFDNMSATAACILGGAVSALPQCQAVHVQGGSNVRMRDVTVENRALGLLCPETPMLPSLAQLGRGILLETVNGVNLHDNVVGCYAIGVHVSASTPVSGGGADMIGHNTIRNNNTANPDDFGVGLFLQGSSGWLINHNTLKGNGNPRFFSFEAAILLLDGASNNQFVKNTVDNNFGPGISVEDSTSIGNRFIKNHAIANGVTDVNDNTVAPANVWNQNNICNVQTGPGIPPGVCEPGEM
jgi:parallel beta-helix repeat protein